MNFLNLPGWEVVEVKESPTDYHVTATIGLEPKGCPHCRTLFEKLHRHGTYEQDIADLPSHGKLKLSVANMTYDSPYVKNAGQPRLAHHYAGDAFV
jgi:glutaredoxin